MDRQTFNDQMILLRGAYGNLATTEYEETLWRLFIRTPDMVFIKAVESAISTQEFLPKPATLKKLVGIEMSKRSGGLSKEKIVEIQAVAEECGLLINEALLMINYQYGWNSRKRGVEVWSCIPEGMVEEVKEYLRANKGRKDEIIITGNHNLQRSLHGQKDLEMSEIERRLIAYERGEITPEQVREIYEADIATARANKQREQELLAPGGSSEVTAVAEKEPDDGDDSDLPF